MRTYINDARLVVNGATTKTLTWMRRVNTFELYEDDSCILSDEGSVNARTIFFGWIEKQMAFAAQLNALPGVHAEVVVAKKQGA